MKKQQILKALHIGDGIAEYEAENLKNYFVSTLEWEKIIEGKSDLILGSKGCGKSALYVNLINESASLRERGILLIPVERPRGNPAFELLGKVGIGSRENKLIADEDNFERKIIGIWKLFLVIVMAKALQDEQNKQKKGKRLFQVLEDENLLPQKFDLGEYLALAIDVIGNGLSESKVEDFTGVLTGMKWSIDFQSRILKKKNQYYISIDELLDDLNEIAENLNLNIWIAIDRLDMAFSEDPHLEEVALRTLIRVYIDCLSLKRLQFKIFLRDDIWQKITTAHQKPLREHSHIRDTSISWEKEKLLNLVVSRLVSNDHLMNEFKSTSTDVLQNYPRQYELFHHVLPETILDENGKETSTMDWMWSWIIDGKGVATPREFIHWLNEAKEKELGYVRIGLGDAKQVFPLISEKALKRSRVKMSKDRIFKTLLAEHKDLSDNIPFDFQDWKESFSIEELAIQMGKEMDEVKGLVRVLLDIGFLGKRTEDSQTNYFVGRVYWASLGASNEG